MRENKFRIWSRKEKRWACGFEDGIFNLNSIFRNREYVAQQFTGLCDVNEREIYEGDIVKGVDGKYQNNFFVGVVRYDVTNAAFVLWGKGESRSLGVAEIRLEIVGNTLQNLSNPELAP